MIIGVAMEYWQVGGAERFWQRLSRVMPKYTWKFVKRVEKDFDIVVYSNAHKFYKQAKDLGKPTVLRITGPRSYTLPQPDDLSAVVCSSRKSFELSQHPKKQMILNGIDFEVFSEITPIKCDVLCGLSRVGVGQRPEHAIKWAIKNNRHLTVTGSKQHLSEDTYNRLKKKYTQVNWTGLLGESKMLQYVKGCEAGLVASPIHGISNFVIECVAANKPIINLGGVEVPKRNEIDIYQTAKQYDELFKAIKEGRAK